MHQFFFRLRMPTVMFRPIIGPTNEKKTAQERNYSPDLPVIMIGGDADGDTAGARYGIDIGQGSPPRRGHPLTAAG